MLSLQAIFFGGLLYGVSIGIFGLKAIGKSTYTIESIVNKEIEQSISKLKNETDLVEILKKIQEDEKQHQKAGEVLSSGTFFFEKLIIKIAQFGAYSAKNIATIL